MMRFRPSASRSFVQVLVLSGVVLATPALAAATLKQRVLGAGYTGNEQMPAGGYAATVGGDFTVQYTVMNGKVSKPVALPAVPGLRVDGSGTNPQPDHMEFNFFVTPTRAGDYVIPAFDIKTDDGQTLHTAPVKFHATQH